MENVDEVSYRDRLQQHVANTYRSLRFVLVIIGFGFPVLLVVVGKLWYGIPWQDSMSAYYWANSSGDGYLRGLTTGLLQSLSFNLAPLEPAPMRSWFVGLLFVLGIFLIVYTGFSDLENWLLNVAGGAALGVALFPMGWDCDINCQATSIFGDKITLHGLFAITTFVAMAGVSIWCAKDTLYGIPEHPDEGKQTTDDYSVISFGFRWFIWIIIHIIDLLIPLIAPTVVLFRRWLRVQDLSSPYATRQHYLDRYYVTGVLMGIFPLLAFLATLVFNDQNKLTFFLELAGIWAFATYWTIKSMELEYSQHEIHTLEKDSALPPHPQEVKGSSAGAKRPSKAQGVAQPH